MTAVRGRTWLIALLSTELSACNALVDAPSATYVPEHPVFRNVRVGAGAVTGAAWLAQPATEVHDNFGGALSLQDGELLVVAPTAQLAAVLSGAANCDEIVDIGGAGRIYAFSRLDDAWIKTGELQRATAQEGEGTVHYAADDQPRIAIARWGDTAAIGVPAATPGRCDPGVSTEITHAGKVHLFERASDGRWTPSVVLTASRPAIADFFGAAVALSEDELFVGAIGDEVATADPGEPAVRQNTGALYVFRREGASWHEVQRLAPGDPQSDAFFGNALSVDGDTLAVGAWLDSRGASGIHSSVDRVDGDRPEIRSSGAVHLFRRREGHWEEAEYLKAPYPRANDNFGLEVALRGDLLLVGAPFESSSHASASAAELETEGPPPDDLESAGAVYAYRRDADGWRFDTYLKAFEPRAGARFGVALSLRGDLVLAGAPYEDAESRGELVKEVGAAYLYAREESGFAPIASLRPAVARRNSLFGSSAALGERLAVIGMPASGDAAGRVANYELQE